MVYYARPTRSIGRVEDRIVNAVTRTSCRRRRGQSQATRRAPARSRRRRACDRLRVKPDSAQTSSWSRPSRMVVDRWNIRASGGRQVWVCGSATTSRDGRPAESRAETDQIADAWTVLSLETDRFDMPPYISLDDLRSHTGREGPGEQAC